MAKTIEELDYRETPLGALVLRKRRAVSMPDTDIYEVALDGAFLMSSLVHDTEDALAELVLGDASSADRSNEPCAVLVGGLGLGYTAAAALGYPHVATVDVVEVLEAVIDWHRHGLVPLGEMLTQDRRCRIHHADFFKAIAGESAAGSLRDTYDAILLDIDHSPAALLDESHAAFYRPEGLRRLVDRLAPGGVFALWSADPPESCFIARLNEAFADVSVEVVRFLNPLLNRPDENTVYLARRD